MFVVIIAFFAGLVGSSVLLYFAGVYPTTMMRYRGISFSFATVAETTKPAVVNISTTRVSRSDELYPLPTPRPPFNKYFYNDFFDRFTHKLPSATVRQYNLGSGVLISKDGYILTNCHVIDNAENLSVRLANGKQYEATIVGRDPKTDIALLKIQSNEPLPFVEMDDSDLTRVGDWVIAIGNPFGLEQTVTAGIISAKGRMIGAGPYDDFIQTDASIYQGNSGGPLLNLSGQVIGINTAIMADGQGIGFAIPINIVKKLLPDLKAKGKVTRGWIGVSVQDMPIDDSTTFTKGVRIADIFKGDPADRAGLINGDIIIAIQGKNINNSHELLLFIASCKVGDTVTIKVLRNNVEHLFNVVIAERTGNKEGSVLEKSK
ncbi:MAG: trypsin-like peptidase domain-containing protein [Deltaproteobacteria bacterium]